MPSDPAAARRDAEKWPEPFSRYVIPEPTSGCFLWIGAQRGFGYGSARLDGKSTSAHRAAWRLTYGTIPDGLWVLHHCDNRVCVNPSHLFLGTHEDNMRDLVSKGRHVGQKKHVCKYGHVLDGDNVRVKRGWRSCVACQRQWSAESNRKADRKERENRRRRERYASDPAYRERRGGRAADPIRETA